MRRRFPSVRPTSPFGSQLSVSFPEKTMGLVGEDGHGAQAVLLASSHRYQTEPGMPDIVSSDLRRAWTAWLRLKRRDVLPDAAGGLWPELGCRSPQISWHEWDANRAEPGLNQLQKNRIDLKYIYAHRGFIQSPAGFSLHSATAVCRPSDRWSWPII